MIGITVVCVGWVLALTTMAVTTVRSERKKRRTRALMAILERSHGDALGIHKASGFPDLDRTVRELNELVSYGAIEAVSLNGAMRYCKLGTSDGVLEQHRAKQAEKFATATYDPLSRQLVFRGKRIDEETFV